jgi:hypothetical protein
MNKSFCLKRESIEFWSIEDWIELVTVSMSRCRDGRERSWQDDLLDVGAGIVRKTQVFQAVPIKTVFMAAA